MIRYGWVFGLLLAVFSTHPSFACQGKTVIFDESFKNPDSGWTPPDDHLSYGSSGATLKVPPGASLSPINWHYTSDGADLCVTGIWPAAAGEYEDSIGVTFWVKDARNSYLAEISKQGMIVVARSIAGAWQPLLIEADDKHPDLIHKQPGGTNEVEVQISGLKAIVWVNGKKIFDLNGQPPPGSGYVGLFTQRVAKGDISGELPPVTFPKFLIAAYP
jgi:hypothetical protein